MKTWFQSFVDRRRFPAGHHSFVAGTALALGLAAGAAPAALFQELPGLSAAAQNSLVAHFDARTGVAITAGEVTGWTPVDGDGDALAGRAMTRSGLLTGVISHDGDDTLSFARPTTGRTTAFLQGTLNDVPAGTAYTIFWRGHYAHQDGVPGNNLYSLGSQLTHARGGNDEIELHNGGTYYYGDSITAHDSQTTVWSTVYSGATHRAFADGTDLAMQTRPWLSYSVPANPVLRIGTHQFNERHFNGKLSDLIIFNSALSDADRALVEGYLAAIPEPAVAGAAGLLAAFAGLRLAARRLRGGRQCG
jgi:hypothetical protein